MSAIQVLRGKPIFMSPRSVHNSLKTHSSSPTDLAMKTPRLINIPPALRSPDLIRRLPRNANFRDRTGGKASGCTVLGYAGILPPSFSAWLCRCGCGKKFIASSNHLNQSRIGCGCKQARHRLSGTHIYSTWLEMMARCYDRRNDAYARYGGRGVTVCKRWRESVERFAKNMGPRPSDGHVLGRNNLTGNFTPANCRWVTKRESLESLGRMTVIEHAGRRLSLPEWAKRLGVTHQAMYYRVRRCREFGADLAEAVATPAGERMPCVPARTHSQ
jgi:hypothetical protein